jgi:ketosteroid isomerase-like protein
MTPEKLQSIAFKWIETCNSKELEKLVSLYDDDAQHFSPRLKTVQPETNGFISGKDAMRAWWQNAFEKTPSLQYQLKSLTANGDRVFMEYIRTVANEADELVAEVLDIREDKIVASRVYNG